MCHVPGICTRDLYWVIASRRRCIFGSCSHHPPKVGRVSLCTGTTWVQLRRRFVRVGRPFTLSRQQVLCYPGIWHLWHAVCASRLHSGLQDLIFELPQLERENARDEGRRRVLRVLLPGRLLKQHEAFKAVPESTTMKEAIESITHDDQLAAASATISQFSAMLPGCKCAAEGAVTTLSNTLHAACKSRQVSRARTARQYVKGPLFCRACIQLRIVFVLIRFVSNPFIDPPLHSQEHPRGPGGVCGQAERVARPERNFGQAARHDAGEVLAAGCPQAPGGARLRQAGQARAEGR